MSCVMHHRVSVQAGILHLQVLKQPQDPAGKRQISVDLLPELATGRWQGGPPKFAFANEQQRARALRKCARRPLHSADCRRAAQHKRGCKSQERVDRKEADRLVKEYRRTAHEQPSLRATHYIVMPLALIPEVSTAVAGVQSSIRAYDTSLHRVCPNAGSNHITVCALNLESSEPSESCPRSHRLMQMLYNFLSI